MFGTMIYNVAREELTGPSRMLNLFEAIADRFNDRQENLAWVTPITNFPVVQNYRKPISNRTHLRYGETVFNVVVETWDTTTLDKDGQRLGASPNIVHSFDAVHMMLILYRAQFCIAPIHDAFGCVAGNMSNLFRITRECFVELYDSDPLRTVLQGLECEDMIPERGNLDISMVLESDYAFC